MAPYDHERSGDGAGKPAGPRCPICQAPVVAQHKPFCSKRCADVDLSRWLKGSYAIPGKPAGEEDENTRETGQKSEENDES